MSFLKPGDPAPLFEGPSQTGAVVRLADFRGKKSVVLYFYPKDETSICTRQACSFRDSYDVFRAAGAEVVGVSADGVDSHRAFASAHSLPFPLLSDADGFVRKAYGVSAFLGLFPGRVTFVIDAQGVIRYVFSSALRAEKHIQEALRILKTFSHQEARPVPGP